MQMTWMQTCTGLAFEPLDPDPSLIRLADVAHSLALTCRFNGHTTEFYSVAQHSVIVSEIVPEVDAVWGLLHDAAEAYIGDMIRPLKQQIPHYRSIEERVARAVAKRFELPWPIPTSVHLADNIVLATEKRDLMAPPPKSWQLLPPPLDRIIIPAGPVEAEVAFMNRANELGVGGP
jgi:hypothetical protein